MTVFEQKEFRDKELPNDLSHHSFTECLFESCQFIEGDWREAKFEGCTFKNCNLSLVKLRGCRLSDVRFIECKLVGLEFFQCEKKFFHVEFLGCIVQTCNFSDLGMKKMKFDGSKIRETYFKYVDLSEASFVNCEMEGSLFHQCDLTKADFSGAKNYMIDPNSNKLKKAKFSFPEVINLLKFFDITIS